jgi:hypothetical protein
VTAARPTTSWQLPSVLVLAVVATGLVLATQVGWQTGDPRARPGLPARRGPAAVAAGPIGRLAGGAHRGLDAAVLVVLGVAMVALAETIPPA